MCIWHQLIKTASPCGIPVNQAYAVEMKEWLWPCWLPVKYTLFCADHLQTRRIVEDVDLTKSPHETVCDQNKCIYLQPVF